MFGNKHTYCKVKFDSEATYWYRSNEYGYRVGMQVIVPVSETGLWKIGTVVEAAVYRAPDVPYPLTQTKRIVGKAGWFAATNVKRHNRKIAQCSPSILDISIAEVKTPHGTERYCTCARERNQLKRENSCLKNPYMIIENYPTSKERDIPPEAQKRLRDFLREQQQALQKRQKTIRELQKRKLEAEIEFEELMEDLDQYN